jgi:hypothetical protein
MDWTALNLIEVTLNQPDDFLKVRETLTRIGVASKTEKKLWQSCHIFHKQGKYYITHFKEMFLLDGKTADFSENDIQRRNRIAKLLEDWELVKIVQPELIEDLAPVGHIKILPHKEKAEWELIPKYTMGGRKESSVSPT